MNDIAAGGVVYTVEGGALRLLFIDDRFGYLSLPKGHPEPGESLEQAALREIEEETGIRGRIVAPLGEVAYAFQSGDGQTVHKTVHYYLIEKTGGTLRVQEEEIAGVRWIPADGALPAQEAAGYPNNRPILVRALQALRREIARRIDHTLLKPEATKDDILCLVEDAVRYGFAAVCVQPWWVPLVADRLRGTGIRPCAVVGFPLGGTLPEAKAYEAYQAVRAGAEEIDVVVNLGALKSGDEDGVRRDLEAVIEAAKPQAAVKVILETALLTEEEKRRAAEWAVAAGADFVKTSTGFGPGGATVEDVRLLRSVVGDRAGVKASGGIRTLSAALALLEAGADRLGTSSGPAIVRELPAPEDAASDEKAVP
ncbi:MAG: Deoxyribose-phosphate aldolase [Hydrogenibacillus schlegelii]|uniref:Deoxyribose-phosphate aldolase n=1 Tax=Hydrogenibacillus schlegelii TaxID=1484 RepID=A0A2T5GDS9_HYDSH|nr:MAG: Deoxyribose-phosphate aldolase [Hydrogenibacillus schlegelii]